jgi:hypothetical protein
LTESVNDEVAGVFGGDVGAVGGEFDDDAVGYDQLVGYVDLDALTGDDRFIDGDADGAMPTVAAADIL